MNLSLRYIRSREEPDGQFAAYCDEFRLVARGVTREEALEYLNDTITGLLTLRGQSVDADLVWIP